MSKKNKGKKAMQCMTCCTYFPDMTCYEFKYDENGLKRRSDGKRFICDFDGHEIKSWYDPCPLKEYNK